MTPILRHVAAASCLATALIACEPRSPTALSCSNDTILHQACVLALPRGAGSLRLSPGALVTPLGSNPDGKHIVLEDSTVVEVWVTDYPVAGLATTNGTGVDSTWHADTTIARLPAGFTTFRVVSLLGGPEYVGLGFITLDTATAVNFSVSTATPSSRDDALRFIAMSISPAAR